MLRNVIESRMAESFLLDALPNAFQKISFAHTDHAANSRRPRRCARLIWKLGEARCPDIYAACSPSNWKNNFTAHDSIVQPAIFPGKPLNAYILKWKFFNTALKVDKGLFARVNVKCYFAKVVWTDFWRYIKEVDLHGLFKRVMHAPNRRASRAWHGRAFLWCLHTRIALASQTACSRPGSHPSYPRVAMQPLTQPGMWRCHTVLYTSEACTRWFSMTGCASGWCAFRVATHQKLFCVYPRWTVWAEGSRYLSRW